MRKRLPTSLIALLLLAGCGKQPTAAERNAAAVLAPNGAIIAERVEGTSPWKVALALDPLQPISQKPVTFRLTVTGNDGKPVAGLAVKVALVMPLMDMGKNEFPAKETAPGVYSGSGSFAMSDEWEVFVTIRQGEKQATHVFNVRVAE